MDGVLKTSGIGLLVFSLVVTLQASESFVGTASVKNAAGSTASAAINVTVDRTTSAAEAEKLVAAFKAGGAAGLKKALAGVPPTGSIRLGGSPAARTFMTLERTTDQGRLLTMITEKPIVHLGSGLPNAKPKAGYDFAVLDLEVGAKGAISGTLAPAARITLKQGAFVIQDYSAELVRITAASASR